MEITGEIVAGESKKFRQRASELISTYNTSMFDLAETLWAIKENKFYHPEFMTFKEYLESLKFKYRRLAYLSRIAEVMDEVGIPRNTYEPVGLARLRAITRLEPNDEWTNPETGEKTPMREFIIEMVNKGDHLSIAEVNKHVKTLLGQVGENDIINKTFGWTSLTYENVILPGIEHIRKMIGSVGKSPEGEAIDASPSRCIEYALADVMNNPLTKEDFDKKHGLVNE